jgi:hypothetical protein
MYHNVLEVEIVGNLNLDNASIKKQSNDKSFLVEAEGTTNDGGWKNQRLVPVKYIQEPDNWLVEAEGDAPTGIVNHMVTPWKASHELSLGQKTTTVTISGQNQKITLKVPH